MTCPSCGSPTSDDQRFCAQCGVQLGAGLELHKPLSIGEVIDNKYELRYMIGMGGMGAIYRAEVVGLGQPVAIKILHPTLAADDVSRRRLENEALLASQIDHPNIVSILDFKSTPRMTYLVMEYLSGQSLADVLSSIGYLGMRRAIHITRQLLSALEAAHRLGVLHRDLKPENIYLTARQDQLDHVKMLDFGMATVSGAKGSRITSQGYVCGTPAYMSPEQAHGKAVDHRSDLYSVGVVLYECLTAINPFIGDTAAETLLRQISHTPKMPSKARRAASIPPYLDALVMRALRKSPADRFSSAAEFRRVLEGLVSARKSDETSNYRVGTTCRECGNPIEPSASRCSSCGEAVTTASPEPEQVEEMLPADMLNALEKSGVGQAAELELSATSTITACPAINADPPFVGLNAERDRISALFESERGCFLRLIGQPGRARGGWRATRPNERSRRAGRSSTAFRRTSRSSPRSIRSSRRRVVCSRSPRAARARPSSSPPPRRQGSTWPTGMGCSSSLVWRPPS